MLNGQLEARELDWACEAPEPRTARVLSIEELRQKLGPPLPQERREARAALNDERSRPRIVWRREAAPV